MRRLLGLVLVAVAAGCSGDKDKAPNIQTAEVSRRTIVVDAQATGTVEPINIVEVKSKASGQVVKMPVETGMLVKPGDLLVQVDTRDVQNQYNQADADLRAASARLDVARAQKKRADEMFAARVITAQEHETSTLDYANAEAQLVRARAALDLAKQRLEDATVTAPVAGTIIERTVALGVVIASATGTFGGGTTLLKMADLNQVRVRALFNETDIGQLRPGQQARVTVDAFPDRPFIGQVEKVEPQAVIQQNVTMFPVLITLSNLEGLLKPGMNGEVNVVVDQRENVLAVPNDAVRNVREGVAVASMLGLDPDSVQAQITAQFTQRRGSRVGPQSGRGGSTTISQGDVELAAAEPPQQGGFQMPQVSDADCAAITAALAKKPAEKKKLDDLSAQMRTDGADRRAIFEQQRQIYESLKIDPRTAGACRRREMMAARGGAGGDQTGAARQGGGRTGGAQSGAGGAGARTAQGGVRPGAQSGEPPLQLSVPEVGMRGRARSGLVFVADSGTYKPRIVMLGASNFDYTEVVSGLQEGEKVALLASAAIQAQRQQQSDRMRQGMGVPGMTPGAGGRPGAGGAGGNGGTRGR